MPGNCRSIPVVTILERVWYIYTEGDGQCSRRSTRLIEKSTLMTTPRAGLGTVPTLCRGGSGIDIYLSVCLESSTVDGSTIYRPELTFYISQRCARAPKSNITRGLSTKEPPGVLATKVGYFGRKSAKVHLGARQMGTKPANVGLLAPGVLKCGTVPHPAPSTDGRLRKKVFALRRCRRRAKLLKSAPGEGQIC